MAHRMSDHKKSEIRLQLEDVRREHPVDALKKVQPLPEKIEISPEKYGEIIKQRRETRMLLQKQLADRIGISPAALSKIESGQTKNIREHIYRFAYELDCSVSFLLGETQNPDAYVENGREYRMPVKFGEKEAAKTAMLFQELRREDEELFDCLYEIATMKNRLRRNEIKEGLMRLMAK